MTVSLRVVWAVSTGEKVCMQTRSTGPQLEMVLWYIL